jgi:hypothetical protein
MAEWTTDTNRQSLLTSEVSSSTIMARVNRNSGKTNERHSNTDDTAARPE